MHKFEMESIKGQHYNVHIYIYTCRYSRICLGDKKAAFSY